MKNNDWLPLFLEYRAGELSLEGVRLAELARRFGTPAYVYSAGSIRAAYGRYATGFEKAGLNLNLCYAVKANSTLEILRLLGELGAGADVVSAGELYRAVRAGIAPGKMSLPGSARPLPRLTRPLKKISGPSTWNRPGNWSCWNAGLPR